MEVNNNTRLLQLQEILSKETDELHELSMKEIMEKLKFVFGPEANFDKRTLKRDMEVLEEAGFEVIQNKGDFGKTLYSYQDRVFETYQLRLLNDAVLSAKFITEKEKKDLIQRIKNLTSKHIAKTLPDPLLFNQSANDGYQLVKLNIDHVHTAIAEQKVLLYQYGKYNMKKEFEYNRDGSTYEVEPYALIWQNDFYYLIGRFRGTGEMRHYRLDRMRNIRLSEERFRKEEINIQDYVDQSFHMFAGENTWIKVQFHASLLNVVLDRFGLDASIQQVDEEHFLLSTKAKMSTGLVAWIMQWGRKAKVVSPEALKEEVREEVRAMFEGYGLE
ncbi:MULTISPECIES: helix-turn-helix transcriptional regulator [Pontibacillus]|uniref:WYL domain-containing protein n=1 Tax=Pontibacillus chungwhensis TaxID=265426 RepID=A0ABY8V176_9BACI|nr:MULTISPECIES: WYL domain-containing protein [Pontibacillus]MCD5324459.1 WYL domain-containing protein [Pontibacillus sp. HN14]WIF99248.1 WYL domain-containing protein [Pontibacillus chungwhensis]